jgi:hypothetical protein
LSERKSAFCFKIRFVFSPTLLNLGSRKTFLNLAY